MSHEEMRVEHEPINDVNRNRAMDVAHEETAPVERVWRQTDGITAEQQFTEQLGKDELAAESTEDTARDQHPWR